MNNIDNDTYRKLYSDYVKGVARAAKKHAMATPEDFGYWKANFQMLLDEKYPKTGKYYSNTELRRANAEMVNNQRRTLTSKQTRAFEGAFAGADWGDDVSSAEAVEIHEYLKNSGFYEARDRGELRRWMAFNGRDLYEFLEALQLTSWHKFFNS